MNKLLFIVLFFSCQTGEITNYTPYLNHNDTVRYVGKEQCRMCHVEIYDSYIQTGMGKSLHYAVKDHSALASSDMPIIYDSIKNLFYEPIWRNDSLYLKEFRLDNNDTSHLLIKKVTYKIGSGHHTNSHLFEINGYLHQMPYTYYTQEAIADLPPGFENGNNTRFSREIGLECMSCHNAHSDHQKGSTNKYNSVPQGIDCERCHGPGEIHVKQKLAGNIIDTSKYIDYSIVNPKSKDKKNLLLLRKNHIEDLQNTISKGGNWVINIKSVRNVVSGENFVYAFPEICENKIIVIKGEKISKINFEQKDYSRKGFRDKINLLMSSSLAEMKRRGSLANEIKLRSDSLKELRDFLNKNDKDNFELEVVSLRNSKTAQPIVVNLNINN